MISNIMPYYYLYLFQTPDLIGTKKYKVEYSLQNDSFNYPKVLCTFIVKNPEKIILKLGTLEGNENDVINRFINAMKNY